MPQKTTLDFTGYPADYDVKHLYGLRTMFSLLNWRLLLLILFPALTIASRAAAQYPDTDGDGLLDIRDHPKWPPLVSEVIQSVEYYRFERMGVEDLDGVNLLSEPTEPFFLSLFQNKITGVEPGDFAGMSNLAALDLSGNDIINLEPGVFDNLENLVLLNLDFNQIDSLAPEVFDGLKNLKRLYLTSNQIDSLDVGVFDGLESLWTLGLGGNDFTRLEPGVFDGLSLLEELDLSGSFQLTSLEPGVFDGLSNLETLVLTGSQLTSLEPGVFEGLFNLETISLRSNRFTSIESGVFVGLDNLSELWLDKNNGLTTVDVDELLGLPSLSRLWIDRRFYDAHRAEFDAFSAMDGRFVIVTPEPSTAVLAFLALPCLWRTRSTTNEFGDQLNC